MRRWLAMSHRQEKQIKMSVIVTFLLYHLESGAQHDLGVSTTSYSPLNSFTRFSMTPHNLSNSNGDKLSTENLMVNILLIHSNSQAILRPTFIECCNKFVTRLQRQQNDNFSLVIPSRVRSSSIMSCDHVLMAYSIFLGYPLIVISV